MTITVFANDTLTIRKIGATFSVDMSKFEAKELRDQLLEKYPVEQETTSVAGPLREVTLDEAQPGDIATFEIKDSPSDGKFVCTLKKSGNGKTLYADKWVTANTRPAWYIRSYMGDDAGGMKDLHIWRWDGVDETAEEAVELPDPPTVAGLYITATSDQVLYNDGDFYANWSRPHGAKWSTGNIYEEWDVVTRDLGPERLSLKFISKKEE